MRYTNRRICILYSSLFAWSWAGSESWPILWMTDHFSSATFHYLPGVSISIKLYCTVTGASGWKELAWSHHTAVSWLVATSMSLAATPAAPSLHNQWHHTQTAQSRILSDLALHRKNLVNILRYKQVHPSLGTAVHPHMPRACPGVHARCQWTGLVSIGNTCCRTPICPILGFWGAKFPKMGDSLPKTPLNNRAKFYTANFILAREIRNRTNKKQTNNKRIIHTLPIVMCG